MRKLWEVKVTQRFVVFTTFLTGSPFNQKVVLISLTWMMLSYAKLGKQGRLVLNIIVVFDTKIKEYKSLIDDHESNNTRNNPHY